MEQLVALDSTNSRCFLCENGEIDQLEPCKFCKQVLFCKTSISDEQYAANNDSSSTNGSCDCNINEINKDCQSAHANNTGNKSQHNEIDSSSHYHAHRPTGLDRCLPFRGMCYVLLYTSFYIKVNYP